MARTDLMGMLKRAFAQALVLEQRSKVDVARARPRVTRRAFLATTAAAGAALTIPPRASAEGPSIVIVGAGIAGLNCAHRLARVGLRAEIYEASKRIGGRMWSEKDVMGPGTVTEMGGEFIDTQHREMHRLVREFELDLLDIHAKSERRLTEVFYFGGRNVSFDEIVNAFRPVAPQIVSDIAAAGNPSYQGGNAAALRLDRTPLSEYLTQIGAGGDLYGLLDVAYRTEYGLDCSEQSAFNLIFLIATSADSFSLFGESDERYKVVGGNQQIPMALGQRYKDRIRLGHRLEAISPKGDGFTLSFAGPNGTSLDTPADVVVLTLPFTLLRDVDIRVDLPPHKKRAIDELGYGTNAKILAGMRERVWRAQGHNGFVYSDRPMTLAWDHTQLQPGSSGGITFYSGGAGGVRAGDGTPEEQAAAMVPDLDEVFPGVGAAYTGVARRMHWPTYPYTRASYTCYRPGQWTSIAGAEFEPVGNMFFAGEHCSLEYQGFMNGAAETGHEAANLVARRVGIRA